MSRPKHPRLPVHGTWGAKEVDDQSGSILSVIMGQLRSALATRPGGTSKTDLGVRVPNFIESAGEPEIRFSRTFDDLALAGLRSMDNLYPSSRFSIDTS
jgi:hypothetical protein